MLTSPTSTHALMQAGYEDGIEPFTKDEELPDDAEEITSEGDKTR